jgi:Flp pilus assembly protein TadD
MWARVGWALVGTFVVMTAGCGSPTDGPAMTPTPAPAPARSTTDRSQGAALDDDARAKRLQELRAQFDADAKALVSDPARFSALASELRSMTNDATDRHLQANAALFLGALHQERGGWAEAAGAYRRAAELIDDDAGPHMALARALAAAGDLSGAAKAQARATELDPDNLEQYLALGELRLRAGDKPGASEAYASYEVRRKGLIDGLTLKHGEAYRVSIDERIACAEALAVAADVGTAFALLYALDTDPEPRVREAVARAIGMQRLEGYRALLTTELADEKDATVREAEAWAIAEIDRDPVKLEQEIPTTAPAADAPAALPPGTPLLDPSAPAAKGDATRDAKGDAAAPKPEGTPAATSDAAGGTDPRPAGP